MNGKVDTVVGGQAAKALDDAARFQKDISARHVRSFPKHSRPKLEHSPAGLNPDYRRFGRRMDNEDGGWDRYAGHAIGTRFPSPICPPFTCAAGVLPSPVFRSDGPLR